jgi:hypothetical protein
MHGSPWHLSPRSLCCRQYDAKLILLTVPACCILWPESRRSGRYALFVTTFFIILNGNFTWILLYRFLVSMHLSPQAFYAIAPVPLSLLATGVFYLWVYARSARRHTVPATGPVVSTQHAG